MRTLITINATVPEAEHPGTPVLVYFDNGDWEIAFLGDTDYIESGNGHYAGYALVIDLMSELRLMHDYDAVDSDGEVAHLFIESETNKGAADEDVFVLYEKDEPFLTTREQAAQLVQESDEAFNFVPVIDFLDDLRRFVALKREDMFSDFDAIPTPFDDEDEGFEE